MSELRVRFAPSPTGYLHVGGARTALFNYLLARQSGGTFVLRIEDTDTERSTQESVDAILDGMAWLGMRPDEGPIYQSERFEHYKSKVQQLLDEGNAYRCYCTPEELDAKREAAMKAGEKPKYDGTCRNREDQPTGQAHVVRFKAPLDGETCFNDKIKGNICFQNTELDDLIIQRTDGTPTYNFVVVIDDAEMKINLIIRGDDHINNTPRQIQLYRALGYDVPEFAHVPMILGSDKKRLSKRHGATSVMAYRDMGYLPEALTNYLVRLGWSFGDEEIFAFGDLLEKFSLDNVGKSAGVFNPEKLLWLNAHWIKNGNSARLARLLKEYLDEKGVDTTDGPNLVMVVESLQERAQTMLEMADGAVFYFTPEVEFDPAAEEKFFKSETKPVLECCRKHLSALGDYNHDAIEGCMKAVMEELGLKFGKIGPVLRVALVGGTQSPSIYHVVEVLGKERVMARIERALTRF